MSTNPNPFEIAVDVTFAGPQGQQYLVPAFYDGDGAGGLDGNVWKVRFAPEASGTWSFSSSSAQALLDNITGSFNVTENANCTTYVAGSLPDFNCEGRLIGNGEHYLQFASGVYWLKGGADDPEDFLAPPVTVGFSSKTEAIDFLASQHVNSMYLLLHNVGGDGQNVWPWVGQTPASAMSNHKHFDVAKLAQWEAIFSYLQEKGITLHLVLEDDSGWTGFDRDLYYRQMVARFAHHNGVIWNLSEEFNENYTANQVKQFAQQLGDLDPYDHPITVHNAGGLAVWQPLVGDDRFDITSFQTESTHQNAAAATWFSAVEASGHTIAVSFDETGQLGSNERDLARKILWSVYLGGGNFELHTSPLVDYLDFSAHFGDMQRARTFVEHLPFWRMQPLNQLLAAGNGYVFGEPAGITAVYLPAGGTITLNLPGTSGPLAVQWYDPKQGDYIAAGNVQGGGLPPLMSPIAGDVALLLTPTAFEQHEVYLPILHRSR
jgi:hypothetical protein